LIIWLVEINRSHLGDAAMRRAPLTPSNIGWICQEFGWRTFFSGANRLGFHLFFQRFLK
jgi:hypothetical protein